MRQKVIGVALLLVALLSGTALASHSYNASEAYVLSAVRQHRGWLSTTPALSHLARDRAREIAAEYERTGDITHRGAFDEWPAGSWCLLGEVIAVTRDFRDYRDSADWVMVAWHNSPPHETVVHSRWSRLGVGVVRTTIRGGDYRFYVVSFGRHC